MKVLKIFLPPLQWSLTDVWEVAEEIRTLKKESGLEIQGFSKEGGLGTLLLLAACTKIYLNPESECHVQLPSAESTFFGPFLKHWGIEVEAYASGPYKSFAESFTRGGFSKEAKTNIESLIIGLQEKILEALTKERKLKPSSFFFPILTARMLVEIGFATGIATEEEFFPEYEKAFDPSDCNIFFKLQELRLFSKGKKLIAVVPLSGGISSGDYAHHEREFGKIEAHSTISLLKELKKDPSVKAIILEIDSPGGSAYHSELIYQEIKKLREEKPVIAYFKDTAASGGYYIGCAAESITASPVCITGSIGAVMIRANIKKLYQKAKIQKESIGFYPYREILSEYTPLKKESIIYLNSEIKRIESQFYARVKEGRNLDDASLRKLGGGRVYLPSVETKIVDKIGGLLDTIEDIKLKFPKQRFLVSYEIPEFNFKSQIPLLGGLKISKLIPPLHSIEQFFASGWLNQNLFLSPFKVRWKS